MATNNQREFQRIAGLPLANWVDDSAAPGAIPGAVERLPDRCTAGAKADRAKLADSVLYLSALADR